MVRGLGSLDDVTRAVRALAKEFDIVPDAARTIVQRYGDQAPAYMRAVREGLTEQAYDLGRGLGAFGTSIDNPDTARRVIQDIADDPAFVRGVTAKELMGIPEFKQYFNTYRNAVRDPKTGDLRKGVQIRAKEGGLVPKLQETTQANPVTKKLLGTKPVKGDVTGELINAAMANDMNKFARIMSQRVTNQMVLLRRLDLEAARAMESAGFSGSRFYGSTADLRDLVSQATGLPRHMVSSAMAVASAGSSPYDELLKLANAAPYIKMSGGKAVIDVDRAIADGVMKVAKKSGKVTGDPVYRVAQALTDAVNGVDPMVDDFSGLALKTYQYRNMGFDPKIRNISVSDRIAQRLAAGAGTGVGETQGLIFAAGPDWVGSQAIGKAEGVAAAVPQELGWFAQRVSEIAVPFNKRRMASPSFPLTGQQVLDINTGVMRPDINAMKIEGKRVGKGLKQVPGNAGIDPEVAAYAQQFENIGQASAGMAPEMLMLPPSMRKKGIYQDIVGATESLSGPLGQVISGLRTPGSKTFGLALPPAVATLIEMARRRSQQPDDQTNMAALNRMVS